MIRLDLMIGCGSVLGLCAGLLTYGMPLWIRRRETRVLRQLCRARRTLVLSFDDGPGRELTPAVLEVLQQHNAVATFFLLGRRTAEAPELVDQILAGGHELGCHGQDHLHAWRTAPWRVWADVDAGYQTLSRWTGPTATFRPPYGKTTFPVMWRLQRRGARLAWWTIDSGDTHAVLPTPESVVEAVRRDGGGVVLLHDFDRDPRTRSERHGHALRTTELLLRLAQSEGYRVRFLGDLLSELSGHTNRSPGSAPDRALQPAASTAGPARKGDEA